MAISNFLLTLVGVGAVAYMMKSDVRHSSAMLRRNLRSIRTWLEEQGVDKASKSDIKQVGDSSTKHQPPKTGGGDQ